MPQGNLTPTQYEILQVVWDRGCDGASVTEIWQAVAEERPVGRTTVLNLVDRLEKRGWLIRRSVDGANRYVAAMDRQQTATTLAREFVDNFFGGSESGLVMSLLGETHLGPDELEQLRRLLQPHRARAREENGPKP